MGTPTAPRDTGSRPSEAGFPRTGPARSAVLIDERGQRYVLVALDDDIRTDHAGTLAATARGATTPARHLTPREAQVAIGVARGLSNKRIADECGVREGTVKSYVHRLFGKLAASSRVELALRLRTALEGVPAAAGTSSPDDRRAPSPGTDDGPTTRW